MQTLRRLIHPEIRIDDEQSGICTYVASDESIDSYGEVIMASGWKFTNFDKNAPFVDSHDYSSINKLVGKVIDRSVQGRRLVETVKWATDVPGNTLAQIGWKMTAAGYLKAVSVGFYPTRSLTPDSGKEFGSTLTSLGLKPNAGVKRIYTQQEQVELSVCIVGANPNALQCAHLDGIIQRSHLEEFPEICRAIENMDRPRSRSFSFGQPQSRQLQTPMSPSKFIERLSRAARRSIPVAREDEQAGQFERARAGNSPSDYDRAVRIAVAKQRNLAPQEAVDLIMAESDTRQFWNDAVRWLSNRKVATSPKFRGIGLQPSGFGTTMWLPPGAVDAVTDFLYTYGAFNTLGVHPAASQFTKVVNAPTVLPSTLWLPPSGGQVQITGDTASAGASTLSELNILACLIDISHQLFSDAAVDLGAFLFLLFTKAIYSGIDYACFQGNGVSDGTSGGQTGIFQDANIPAIKAQVGGATVANLQRDDFENVIAAVTPAALQREPRWWIHPSFLPQLARVHSGTGPDYVLRGPGHTNGAGWFLLDFPVTWTAQAPSATGPGAKICAFGDGAAYQVSIREEFALGVSHLSPQAYANFQEEYIGTARVLCQDQNPASFATLQLSAA